MKLVLDSDPELVAKTGGMPDRSWARGEPPTLLMDEQAFQAKEITPTNNGSTKENEPTKEILLAIDRPRGERFYEWLRTPSLEKVYQLSHVCRSWGKACFKVPQSHRCRAGDS